jgi:hypothetical protein
MGSKKFPWGKLRLVRSAEHSAVSVVLNVGVKTEAQNFILPLSLHDCYWKDLF